VALRVLIVDDSSAFRQAAREVLERRGYEVVGEADGIGAAIDAARTLRPDAALVDLRLADGTGYQASAALTEEHPELAVLLASADRSAPTTELVSESGARGYVFKSRLVSTDFGEFWPRP
jgi:DNA-binding NarL/FixJ family response regulator